MLNENTNDLTAVSMKRVMEEAQVPLLGSGSVSSRGLGPLGPKRGMGLEQERDSREWGSISKNTERVHSKAWAGRERACGVLAPDLPHALGRSLWQLCIRGTRKRRRSSRVRGTAYAWAGQSSGGVKR